MVRFANLVELAFRQHKQIQLTRLRWAPQAATLKKIPAKLRTGVHHSVIASRALLLRQRDFDLFHVADGSHAYVTRWLPPARTIVTSHDIIPWLQRQGRFDVPRPGRVANLLIQAGLQGLDRAKLVLADSVCTQTDLLSTNVIRSEIEVCPLALEPEFLAPQATAVRTSNEVPIVLHIGNNGFYKNRPGVVEIFSRVRQAVAAKLVLAGPPASSQLKQRVRELGLEADVNFLIDPSDSALHSLYRQASLLLFPSFYEGFGWPPLEAMASGCPVVASDAGSLPEVTGAAALTAAPHDVAQLAAHSINVLSDSAVAHRLRQAGYEQAQRFSLERLRDQLLSAYQRVGSRE